MTFANYSVMNTAKIPQSTYGSAPLWSHTRTRAWNKQILQAELPNLPILHLWLSQSGLQLLHYGKQQGQRSSLVATPSSKQRNQTKVLVNANLIHSLGVQFWIISGNTKQKMRASLNETLYKAIPLFRAIKPAVIRFGEEKRLSINHPKYSFIDHKTNFWQVI